MFNRLKPAGRMCFAAVLICAVPVLFISALYIGNREKEPEPVKKEEAEPITYSAPLAVTAREEVKLPSEADKVEAQEVAVDFISTFHSVDAENPYAYIEDSKPFVTDKFYEDYHKIPKRGTLAAATVESVSEEALPLELSQRMQIWSVVVTSEEVAGDGTVVLAPAAYSVLLIKEGQNWKVDGVRSYEF